VEILEKQFPAEVDQRATIYMIWGVEDINRDKASMWKSRDLGQPVLDSKFDPTLPSSQQYLIDFCQALGSQDFVVQGSVKCWIEDFRLHLADQSLNLPTSNQYAFKNHLNQWINTTALGRAAVEHDRIGIVDGEIRYMQVEAKTAVAAAAPAKEKRPEYEKWENFTKTWQASAPNGLKSLCQASKAAWVWMPTETAFVRSGVQGAATAGVFALLVLLFASRNIVVGLLSLLSVAIVIVSVLAFMRLLGWHLGVSESFAIVVLVGLSVDYVVHLAADYTHSAHIERSNKMRQAYIEKGASILSGTITSFVAGAFLLLGEIVTFEKFAILLMATVVLSFVIAMFFFGALCHILGPQSGLGALGNKQPGREHEEELDMLRVEAEMQV